MYQGCEMYECVACKKEINIQNIKKCSNTCMTFKCPSWFCSTLMHINKDGNIKKGHDEKCKSK